jgi:hypothetical protein
MHQELSPLTTFEIQFARWLSLGALFRGKAMKMSRMLFPNTT